MKKFCETPGFHDFFGKNHKINCKLWQFHNFFEKKCQNNVGCSICAYIDSNRNTISEWAVIFRYGNFFIPRVEKSSKISPWEKNLASRGPTALGLIFEDFSTLGMKKFPYLKNGPFGNCIFQLNEQILLMTCFANFKFGDTFFPRSMPNFCRPHAMSI